MNFLMHNIQKATLYLIFVILCITIFEQNKKKKKKKLLLISFTGKICSWTIITFFCGILATSGSRGA